MSKIDELRLLLEAATPGPWEQGSAMPRMIGHASHDALQSWWLVARLAKVERRKRGKGVDDAALIVAAVNALPALLEAAEALKALEPWIHPGYTLLSTNPAAQRDSGQLQVDAMNALENLNG